MPEWQASAAFIKPIAKAPPDPSPKRNPSEKIGSFPRAAALGKEPIFSLGLRLGEGSGGALAIGLMKAALACHSGMATFAEAGVSED